MAQTQVGIVGAGPAGLLLSHLLHRAGIESVVVESRSREYVEKRVRAGVLEHPTVELLREVGLGERMDSDGMPHHGLSLRFDGEDHRIPLTDLTGRTIMVYGQQEVVKDLIAARLAAGGQVLFDSPAIALPGVAEGRPAVIYRDPAGRNQELRCDVVVGCDGSHGISRGAARGVTAYEREYPFAWLGILARTPPSHHELIYTYSDRGFALHSMRSPEITRLYLQVAPDEDLAKWPDDRIWSELTLRLQTGSGFALREGPILEKGITPMRSVVVEPMRYGRLFLAGDAAHIVPPTGAKGMNLDFAHGREDLLDAYSQTCLRRVWRAEHFSWWMTSMLHRFPGDDAFQQRLQLSQLRYTASSTAAATSLAENYVGLPFE
jgi:p-hydroxybenzoate 3-monooxygenase